MKIKEIISILSEKNNFSKTLLEKDLIIHLILLHLSKNKDFKEKYAFKGGTCLIKAYFDYYRFSEDLDFTFINQHLFKNKSKKQIRKLISKELDLIINLLNDFHKDLIFEPDKSNKKFFEFGAGNIFTTIKMYYKSIETKKESFIKLQFNFMEKLFYPIKIMKLNSILKNKEDEFLYPDYFNFLFQKPEINCYDLNEILLEKVRAVLTRKNFKARDFIDIYKITNGDINKLKKHEKKIIEKTKFSLIHEKYEENIKQKINNELYKIGDEENLLINPIKKDFYDFIKELEKYIQKIIKNNFL